MKCVSRNPLFYGVEAWSPDDTVVELPWKYAKTPYFWRFSRKRRESGIPFQK
jgi:hypothetical protein